MTYEKKDMLDVRIHILTISILYFAIEKNAIKRQKIKRISEGRCFTNGFFILKWKYCALTINNPIRIEDVKTNDGYQIPAISNVANEIFDAPIKFLVTSLNPNCLNSVRTLWYLKIQTKATDSATVICSNCIK